jgi:hypothetical protein
MSLESWGLHLVPWVMVSIKEIAAGDEQEGGDRPCYRSG